VDRREEPRVRKNAVEDKDEMDVAEVMVKTFTEQKAIEVAIEIMKGIECNEEAAKLEGILKKCTNGAGQSGSAKSKYMVGDKHFVDVHRRALIERVRTVAPILDELLEKGVIKDEAYNDIKSERTPQKQIRALFDISMAGCGIRGKDIFYEVLERNEQFIIQDLKGE